MMGCIYDSGPCVVIVAPGYSGTERDSCWVLDYESVESVVRAVPYKE